MDIILHILDRGVFFWTSILVNRESHPGTLNSYNMSLIVVRNIASYLSMAILNKMQPILHYIHAIMPSLVQECQKIG